MNTLHAANKNNEIDKNKPVNLSRVGKAIVESASFNINIEVKKRGGMFIALVDGRIVYSAGNCALDCWVWLKRYLSIKNC